MSDTTDVKLLTLNQKTVFNTSAAIARVKLHNNSSYFLRVYYGADAPTDATSGAGWHDTIDPGGTPLLEVVGNSAQTFANRSYIQSTPYLGTITVVPFLPVGSLISSGGVITGSAFVYLTAYYPGEWAQEGGEIEAYVQAAKQARYQVVFGGARNIVGTTDQGTAAGRVGGSMGSFTPANSPNLFNANLTGPVAINFAIYSYFAYAAGTLSPQVWGTQYALLVAVTDSTGAIVRQSLEVIRARLAGYNGAAAQANDHIEQTYAHPLVATLTLAQGTLQSGDLPIIRFVPGASGGNFQIDHNITMLVDTVNQTALLDLPMATLGVAAFNPTNNPQTY